MIDRERALIRVNFCKQAVKEREMAFFDDPQQLIAHLRHSFVTSDDTGRVGLETDNVGSVSQNSYVRLVAVPVPPRDGHSYKCCIYAFN